MKSLLNCTSAALAGLWVLTTGTALAKSQADITVAVIPKVAVPFFDDCNKGASEEAKDLGVKYQWVVPENTQGATQVKIIEDLTARHVDGIAISVNEPRSVQGVIKQAIAAGIKVLTYDSDSANSGRSMYIGTVNEKAGEVMGQQMAEAINGEGKIAIVTGQLGASNLNERIAGVKKALAAYPKITIVDTEGTEDDLAKAVSVTEALFRAHPDLKGLFGVSQVGGPAATKVLAEQEFADRKGKLKIFAFDDLPDTLRGVKDGYINGIMVQRPVTMGHLAVQHLVSEIQGKETDAKDIDTGVTVVTSSNIGSYTK
jgi:ribose transport system substrate-binding protein